ncbi:hypothetical protein R1sor_025931 [Riccia sorocarpa]|uniref:FH2 domain-containing protein n=1 Tax=Riccia sorocarpa TaxID=122646 RepID=A0ABD3GAJ8_9MARC
MTTTKISLKYSVEEIERDFKNMDVSNVANETVDNLLKLFPTSEQMDRFGAWEQNTGVSNSVAELYFRMIQTPCVEKMLRIALLKSQFAERFDPINRNLNLLSNLSTEAIRSSKLRQLLDAIPTNFSGYQQHPVVGSPPTAPSLTNPLFQLALDRQSRSTAGSSPPPPPPLPPQRYQLSLHLYDRGPALLSLPPRAHLVWNESYVLKSEPSPHYTWKIAQDLENEEPSGHEDEPSPPCTTTEVKTVAECKQGCPAPPPPPPDWHSWTPKDSPYQRVARRREPKELELLAKELKEKEDLINASRIENGYYKLRAAGEKGSSVMRDLCKNLIKCSSSSSDLSEFSILSEIPCLKEAEGVELMSWKQCQKELQNLSAEFDEADVQWKTSVRKCIEAESTRDRIDDFIRDKELELQNLTKFLTEVRTKTENLFYHLEADRHKRRQPPAYLDEDAPIVGLFLQFVDCFKSTVRELQLERDVALQLPNVNLLDAIFGTDELQRKLDVNHLKNLLSFCPSEVQIRMFRHLVGQEESVEKAREKLFLLPLIQGKLKLLSVKKNLPAQVEKLRSRLTNLLEATKEILQSEELNNVVKLIPSLKTSGPPLPWSDVGVRGEKSRPSTPPTPPVGSLKTTSSDRRRIAQGLDLKLLYQLRPNSMHNLVKCISEEHPELLEFHKSLPHLESGTEAADDLLTTADDIRSLAKSIQVVETELTNLRSDSTSNDSELSHTIALWETFHSEAEAEYDLILKLWAEARSQTYLLLDYFHENRVQFPVRQALRAILYFVWKFMEAVKRIGIGASEPEEEPMQFETESTLGAPAPISEGDHDDSKGEKVEMELEAQEEIDFEEEPICLDGPGNHSHGSLDKKLKSHLFKCKPFHK